MTRLSGKTPMNSRTEVEMLHAQQRLAAAAPRASPEGQSLKPPARVDAVFHDVSFTPTDTTGTTTQGLFRALLSGDREALSRAFRRRERRHPTELK